MTELQKSTSNTTRTRLPPEQRKEMILDHAAEIIRSEGVANLKMEQLGRGAGVSKSLIYSYYPSLTDLLQALYTRENEALRKQQQQAVRESETIEELVRKVTQVYLAYVEERGTILEKLQSEPAISGNQELAEYGRKISVDYLSEIVSRTLGVGMEVAAPAVDISFGLPSAAGHYLLHHDLDRKRIEDITVTMIIGAIEAISNRYAVAFQPIIRGKHATEFGNNSQR